MSEEVADPDPWYCNKCQSWFLNKSEYFSLWHICAKPLEDWSRFYRHLRLEHFLGEAARRKWRHFVREYVLYHRFVGIATTRSSSSSSSYATAHSAGSSAYSAGSSEDEGER